MYKKNTHTHNQILLFSHTHEKRYLAICDMDGTWEHYAKWNSQVELDEFIGSLSYVLFRNKNKQKKTYWYKERDRQYLEVGGRG